MSEAGFRVEFAVSIRSASLRAFLSEKRKWSLNTSRKRMSLSGSSENVDPDEMLKAPPNHSVDVIVSPCGEEAVIVVPIMQSEVDQNSGRLEEAIWSEYEQEPTDVCKAILLAEERLCVESVLDGSVGVEMLGVTCIPIEPFSSEGTNLHV